MKLYNSYSRLTESFIPIKEGFVGIYICGPTVYGEPHLGHVRGPIVFDILFRYLKHQGLNVRFIRNITDVGHLLNDADEGEDKLAVKAKLEQVEPMEIAQKYTLSYHQMLQEINTLPASVEPRASGHIIEQIEMVQEIIDAGFAYATNGSVYFNVKKYAASNDYGKLSGRKLEDLIAGAGNEARELSGQDEKENPEDFALWKKAEPMHIMQWNSPWGRGFPGWHIECSAMCRKYLGNQFDIHGGGMDLLFPHHESEIAQSKATCGINPAKYWLHHNMVTINGQKMAKSLGNGISVKELFSGEHKLLEQSYDAMTLRLFILQAHYRSTLDFSNQALQASEKGLQRLLNGLETSLKLKPSTNSSSDIKSLINGFYTALEDDLNTPVAISKLFDLVKVINSVNAGKEELNQEDILLLQNEFPIIINDILGLKNSQNESSTNDSQELINILLSIRDKAKAEKNYTMSDSIRDQLSNLGYTIKDSKEGASVEKL